MHILDRAFISVPCPKCQYEIDVQFRSIHLEDFVFCACCKVQIHLIDSKASSHTSRHKIHSQMYMLQEDLQRMHSTIALDF